jgi:hypothetical protein
MGVETKFSRIVVYQKEKVSLRGANIVLNAHNKMRAQYKHKC